MWQTLQSLPEQCCRHPCGQVYWHIQAEQVYYLDEPIPGADAASFAIWPGQYLIGRDRHKVFAGSEAVRHADPHTLHCSGLYWQDQNRVYIRDGGLLCLKKIDVAHFQELGEGYAHDGTQAYYYGQLLKACTHPDSLHIFPGGYAADAGQVYYQGKPIKQADAASWRPLDPAPFSCDSHHVYYETKRLPRARPDNWQHLYADIWKSGPWVYRGSLQLHGENGQDWNSDTARYWLARHGIR